MVLGLVCELQLIIKYKNKNKKNSRKCFLRNNAIVVVYFCGLTIKIAPPKV
jgi:hypothetical protein